MNNNWRCKRALKRAREALQICYAEREALDDIKVCPYGEKETASWSNYRTRREKLEQEIDILERKLLMKR